MRYVALTLVLLMAACGDDDSAGGDRPALDGAPADIDAAAGGDSDAGAVPTCEEYCSVVREACTEKLRQWYDLESCLETCAILPTGNPGDETGDSLACRAYHARLALDEPDPHCYHAGPSGDGVCGDSCDGYCDIMMSTCDGYYADDAECMEVCATFPDPRPYTIFESRSDTVGCRIFHGTLATVHVGHCPTASADSLACTE